MLEAYAVGVKLEMTSNVGGVLDKLIADFDRFNVLVKETSSALSRLGRNLRGDWASLAGLDRMAEAMKAAESAGAGLTRTLRSNAEYASETAKAMQASARAMAQAGRSGQSAGGHGGGRFSEHNVMMAGMGAGIVGGALLDAVRHVMTPAIDVNRTRDVLAADMRLTPDQVDAAMARARETTKLAPGTTTGENLASTLDLKNIFGDLGEATKMLPEFARMTALFQALDRKGGGSGEQSYAAGKALEVMAGIVDERTDAAGHTVRSVDPELGMRRLKEMERVAVATNMRVLPSDYLSFAKQARVAGMTLSDEFTYEKLPALMQVLGGSRTGTALMSMAQVFQGGKLTNKSMGALIDIGLASAGGITYARNKRGGRGNATIHSEAIYDEDLMMHDPLKYIEAAQKRMEAKGIHGTEAQIRALMNASQRTTIAGIFADLLKDMPAILKEQQNIQNTRPDMAQHMAEVDPAAKLQQFEAALTNLATELGSAGMKDAMAVLDAATRGLNALGEWAHENPGLARIAFDVAAGLGAVATALGALSTAILVFGPALRLLGLAGGGTTATTAVGAGGVGAAGLFALGGAGTAIVAAGTVGAANIAGVLSPYRDMPTRAEDFPTYSPPSRTDPTGSGATVRLQSYHPAAEPTDRPIHLIVSLDGKQLSEGIQVHRNRESQRPRTGRSTFDGRMHLLYST